MDPFAKDFTRVERVIHWVLSLFLAHKDIVKFEDGETKLYLRRYFIVGYQTWLSRLIKGHIFLHQIYRSDNDRHLHDHPWSFKSLILWNGYREEVMTLGHVYWTQGKPGGRKLKTRAASSKREFRTWNRFDVIKNPSSHIHRVQLHNERPTWTLVFASERERDWGFWNDDEPGQTYFIPHRDYLNLDEPMDD